MTVETTEDVVLFGRKEIDPAEEVKYKEKIARAKLGGVDALKGSTPLGGVERPQIPLLRREGADVSAAINDTGGVQPRPPGSPLLSEATKQQLTELGKIQADAAAQPPKEEPKKEEVDLYDLFDFEGRNEAEKILNNKKRRKDIEGRCVPMAFEDLLLKDEVRQSVPILPGKFEVVFRSLLPSESLFVKQYIAKEQDRTDGYLAEKYSLCQLCMAVVSINGKSFGAPHINDDGTVNPDLFELRLKSIVRKSAYIVADLGVNYAWFDIRVRKLISPDEMGNG